MSLTDLLVMREIIGIPDALIYALIGFSFVFLGIIILIVIVSLIGFIMQKTRGLKLSDLFKKKEKVAEVETVIPTAREEDIPNEVKAAIMAAIMAYYNVEKPKCEFVVKKIKRI